MKIPKYKQNIYIAVNYPDLAIRKGTTG